MAGRDDDDEGDDDDNGEVAGGESSGASNSQSVSRLSSENIFLFLIVLSFLLRSPDFVSQMTLALSSFSRTKIGLILKNERPSLDLPIPTGRLARMSHRKWRETKQQLIL